MKISYDTINGKWWEFHDGSRYKPVDDSVAVKIIWGGEIPKCTDCRLPVQRITPSIGNYCDDCWPNHMIVVVEL